MTPSEGRRPAIDGLRRVHGRMVWPHRVHVLSSLFLPLIPTGASVLDIGCGDGAIGARMQAARPDLSVSGVEVEPRPGCGIDVQPFDGARLPLADGSRDFCLFIDVLHHVADAEGLLREASRVARKGVLLKDHMCRSRVDRFTLAAMDWFGNRTYGLRLPHWYRDEDAWSRLFASCGLTVAARRCPLALYPFPFSILFNRHLHFMAMLEGKTEGGHT